MQEIGLRLGMTSKSMALSMVWPGGGRKCEVREQAQCRGIVPLPSLYLLPTAGSLLPRVSGRIPVASYCLFQADTWVLPLHSQGSKHS